ncbi:hypothetical protein ACIBF5_06210 [Micromonospora sp. NPDC050417]|uniref:hypothetical protein n=1 Tax=Micromonospora sp. NPDC050417 TaxID=3364280 RepID=UPI00379B8D4F
MADQNEFAYDDSGLDAEFTAFRTGLIDQVVPPGPDAVRSTVRHRKRVATTTGVALALVLVVGPVAGYAALNRPSPPTPGPAVTGTPTIDPTPSTSPTPSPTPSPSGTPAAPDGKISKADLLNARVTLPAWRSTAAQWCVTKNVRLDDDPKMKHPSLVTLVHGDVDDDGADETVALLTCPIEDRSSTRQVVAFDRDDAGNVVTLGQVVNTGAGIDQIMGIQFDGSGTLRAQVGDIPDCCAVPKEWSQKQWRGYRWNGSEFTQTSGPESFGPNPLFTDLRVVSASRVTFTENPEDPVWGMRHGSVTVKIRNAGSTASKTARLTLTFDTGVLRHEGNGWSACTKVSNTASVPANTLFCDLAPLRPGEERTLVLGLGNSAAQPDSGTATADLSNRQMVENEEFVVPDSNDRNNRAQFQFG